MHSDSTKHNLEHFIHTYFTYNFSSFALPSSAVVIVAEAEDGLAPTCVSATIEHLYS